MSKISKAFNEDALNPLVICLTVIIVRKGRKEYAMLAVGEDGVVLCGDFYLSPSLSLSLSLEDGSK